MNVNSATSNSYTSEAYSSSGFTGMMSGIDTESLVESMLSGVQSKIDKQNQEQQKIEWQQEMYRSVISKIQSFQSKYFDLTSSTSLRTESFFNTMTTVSSNSAAVKIAATTSSMEQQFTVQAAQLAKAAKLTSGKISTGEIQLNFDPSFFDTPTQELAIKVGDAEKSINLLDYSSAEEIAEAINGMNLGVNATVEEGKLKLDGGETEFAVSGSENAISTLGLKSGTVSKNDGDLYVLESGKEVDLSKLDSEPKTTAELTVSLNGISRKITISSDEADPMEALRTQLAKNFGTSVNLSDDGVITTGSGQSVTISGDVEVFGLSKTASTSLRTSSTLAECGIQGLEADENGKYNIEINGESFTFEATDTINKVISTINDADIGVTMSYNSLSDAFSLVSDNSGKGFEINVSGNLGDAIFSGAKFTEGQNAVANINGVMVERTENNFSYNGVSIELKSTTGSYQTDGNGGFVTDAEGNFVTVDSTVDNAASVESTRNTDKVYDTIKEFVNDYNALIKELNGYTHAAANDYEPLTDAQRKEMSESEIEKWEAKAKEDLLRNDKDISSFLTSMRTAIYSKAGENGNTLAQFGVNSSSDWKEYGKLEIDEEQLKNALNTNAEAVMELFTGTNGLATKLETICKNTANVSSASPGTLVQLAGVEGKASEKNNTLNSRLDAIKEKLSRLQDVYEMRKTRFWNQFNAMETALSNMNSTSGYLTAMLGG